MILQCPECNARFAVPDAQIPPQGRTVRCGRCKHEWHVAPPPPEDSDDWDPLSMPQAAPAVAVEETSAPEEPAPASDSFEAALQSASDAMPDDMGAPLAGAEDVDVPPPAQVPSLQPWAISKTPFMIATPLLFLLFLGLMLVAHYNAWSHMPVLKSIYAAVGATPTDGLAFDDVVMKREEKDSKTNFMLSGSITNRSASDRVVPTVRVKLLDAKGKTIWSRDYVVKEPLKGGDVYPFRITNVETGQGSAVANLVVDLGNSIQLMLR